MSKDSPGQRLPCRGCGEGVWVDGEVLVTRMWKRQGRTYRSVSVRCAACQAAIDERLRAEFPWLFPGEG